MPWEQVHLAGEWEGLAMAYLYITPKLPYDTSGVPGTSDEVISYTSLVQSHARHNVCVGRREG